MTTLQARRRERELRSFRNRPNKWRADGRISMLVTDDVDPSAYPTIQFRGNFADFDGVVWSPNSDAEGFVTLRVRGEEFRLPVSCVKTIYRDDVIQWVDENYQRGLLQTPLPPIVFDEIDSRVSKFRIPDSAIEKKIAELSAGDQQRSTEDDLAHSATTDICNRVEELTRYGARVTWT